MSENEYQDWLDDEKQYQSWLDERWQLHELDILHMLQRDADNMVGDVFEDYPPADDDETLDDYQPREIKTRTVRFSPSEE